MKKNPTVELKLPILKDMELVATHTSDVVAKYMNLSEEKSAEISMALIEACINAFEHSETKEDIYIHFIISDDMLTIKVIDKGVGFDASSIELPNIDKKITDERDITVLVSSHDLRHVTEVCDRIVVLDKGIVVKDLETSKKTLKRHRNP